MRCYLKLIVKIVWLVIPLAGPSVSQASPGQVLVVGANPATCPNAAFSQIQTAIDEATPGASIHVCSGVYPEQVTVDRSLDMDADSGVFIVPPALKQNATSLATGVPIAAGIFVSGADKVSIHGFTVDEINNSIFACTPRLEGVYYQNASGTIDGIVVRNIMLAPGFNGCQSGTGIFVESGNGGTSQVEIEGCRIYGFQKNGITANEVGTQVSIHGNIVTGLGPTAGAAQNGIQVGFGATGDVKYNTVANMIWSPCTAPSTCQAVATNILVFESDGVEVRENTATISQVGIFAQGNNETVSDNRVADSSVFDGIRLVGNGSKVESNVVATASEALIFLQGNSNDITHNTLSDSQVGILKVMGSTQNELSANRFDNVVIQVADPAPMSIVGRLSPER
jgi:nitrous oxidase accessory protein NosD